MSINNYHKLVTLAPEKKEDGVFLFLQIIRRPKDHPDNKRRANRVLGSYLIRCQEDLHRLMPEVMLLCEHYGARAYLDPCLKSFKECDKTMLLKISESICFESFGNPMKIVTSAIGTTRPESKAFIIDVDNLEDKENILLWLNTQFSDVHYLVADIPTVHGCHLITKPFNRRAFNMAFPGVEIKYNSGGTLLYYPSVLETSGTPEESSYELWHKWLRQGYGLAINVTAHDGDTYSWEPVYLSTYRGPEVGSIAIDSTLYQSYELALKAGVLFGCRLFNI